MKYCRFLFERKPHYGKVETRAGEDWIVDLAPAPEEDVAFHLARLRAEAVEQLVTDLAAFDFEPMPLASAQLLAPVTPSKILCVGRNYREHAKELGNEVPSEPLIFSKPPSSLLAPGGVVRMPAASQRVDFEGELALVIGKRISRLQPDADWRGAHPRLHPGQRCNRPRPAEKRSAVDPPQRLGHLLPRRPHRQR